MKPGRYTTNGSEMTLLFFTSISFYSESIDFVVKEQADEPPKWAIVSISLKYAIIANILKNGNSNLLLLWLKT